MEGAMFGTAVGRLENNKNKVVAVIQCHMEVLQHHLHTMKETTTMLETGEQLHQTHQLLITSMKLERQT